MRWHGLGGDRAASGSVDKRRWRSCYQSPRTPPQAPSPCPRCGLSSQWGWGGCRQGVVPGGPCSVAGQASAAAGGAPNKRSPGKLKAWFGPSSTSHPAAPARASCRARFTPPPSPSNRHTTTRLGWLGCGGGSPRRPRARWRWSGVPTGTPGCAAGSSCWKGRRRTSHHSAWVALVALWTRARIASSTAVRGRSVSW